MLRNHQRRLSIVSTAAFFIGRPLLPAARPLSLHSPHKHDWRITNVWQFAVIARNRQAINQLKKSDYCLRWNSRHA
jgi:hypothetical protein